MSNELVLKKLFALAQSKPAPHKGTHNVRTSRRLFRGSSGYRGMPTSNGKKPLPNLYLSMTITRRREIEALYETLELFSRLLDEDD